MQSDTFWPATAPLPQADAAFSSLEMRAQARERIYEAAQAIPNESKAAFLEARDKAPYLFENESDPYKFLLACDFNIWEAAQRMIRYWEVRKNLFGPYRTFLPLTLTGDGALTKEDIMVLQGGCPSVLPQTASGKHVIYCDRRQLSALSTPERRLRTAFYLCRVYADDERIIQQGLLILILVVTPRVVEVDLSVVRRAIGLGWNVFPLKIAEWHLLNCPPKNLKAAKQYIIQDLLVSYLSSFADKGGFSNINVHFEREPGDIFNFLHNKLGMSPDGIPREFGGTWDFTCALSWCRKQTLNERETYKLILQAAKRYTPAASLEDMPETDKASKRRAKNALHSKRKRERRLQEEINLSSEHSQLNQENLGLKAEYARLENLLKQAKEMIPC